jgi:hypothetical protein
MAEIGHNSGTRPGNWISVSRDMRDHSVVGMGQPVRPADTTRGSYSKYEAWQDLLMEAQWKPFEVINRGKTVNLKRGQIMAAKSWLAARWNWTEKTVRIFIAQLEEEFMVRSETAPVGKQTGRYYNNIMTICNYDIYQTVHELMSLSDAQSAQNQGQIEGPNQGQLQGQIQSEEKPFENNVIDISKIKQGQIEGQNEGPNEGPQYNKVKNNVLKEREDARARDDGSCRMPDDWYLPNEWGQWAMHECKRDRDWVITASKKFKDYWLSVPDSRGFKKNWRSTWQNWCRNTLQREAKYNQGKPSDPKTKYGKFYEGVL